MNFRKTLLMLLWVQGINFTENVLSKTQKEFSYGPAELTFVIDENVKFFPKPLQKTVSSNSQIWKICVENKLCYNITHQQNQSIV